MIEPEKPEEDVKKKITPDQIDEIILAEIPDSNIDPGLFEVISKNMVHGPCGTIKKDFPCMKDSKCTKCYPKVMHTDIITGNGGYPQYRRRSIDNGGKLITVKVKNLDFEVDNHWIVPYSPLFSKTFKAHINVEYCNSVKSIKYICKYVNKGSDMAVFGIEDANTTSDEIDRYKLGRYISRKEAAWRIFAFPIHERYPTVLHLAVHLENRQRVYFTTENVRAKTLSPSRTTLNECLKSSLLRNKVKILSLKSNMRVQLQRNTSAKIFAQKLLDIGNGTIVIDRSTQLIVLPQNFCTMTLTKEELITKVFPNIVLNYKNHKWLSERTILAAKNNDVNTINYNILQEIPGALTSYKSIDTNINPPQPCNGTRLSVKKLMKNIIEATILNGKFKGLNVLLPPIPMIPTDISFEFKRLQFPALT
ncbi:hypothetical protein TKK_0018635 [Trichogramma kaykai]